MGGDEPLQLVEAPVRPACERGTDLGLQGVVPREDRAGLPRFAAVQEVGGT
jgi:hypothetical protein